MRRHWVTAGGCFIGVVACMACGGGEAASGGAKSAEVSPEVEARTPSTPSTPSEPPTTTAALGGGGDTSGTKLAEAPPPAAPPAASGGSGPGGRSHEPGRSVADIRAIIIAHRDEARACYDKALASHPGIEGDLVIDWTIDPKGNVSKISLDTARSQITEPAVAACVVDIVKKIQFASSPGGYETRASYPFNFHPRRSSPSPTP